jgi:iron complex transport system ATP-binding protein
MNIPILQASSLRSGYHGCEVLHDISFTLQTGEVLGVIGPNGSGKSTLLKTLTGLLPLLGGFVQINGQDLSKLGARERARLCAVQPQMEAPTLDFTVREFVLLGRHPHRPLLGLTTPDDHTSTLEAMEWCDLQPLATRSIRSLSTGEWQRALLARALAQNTPLLMLDEPAAHLDPGHRYDTHVLLHNLARQKNRAVLCISHDLNLAAEFCDRLMLLGQGRLRALGTPREVLQEKLLQEVFACPALRITTNPHTGQPGVCFTR